MWHGPCQQWHIYTVGYSCPCYSVLLWSICSGRRLCSKNSRRAMSPCCGHMGILTAPVKALTRGEWPLPSAQDLSDCTFPLRRDQFTLGRWLNAGQNFMLNISSGERSQSGTQMVRGSVLSLRWCTAKLKEIDYSATLATTYCKHDYYTWTWKHKSSLQYAFMPQLASQGDYVSS